MLESTDGTLLLFPYSRANEQTYLVRFDPSRGSLVNLGGLKVGGRHVHECYAGAVGPTGETFLCCDVGHVSEQEPRPRDLCVLELREIGTAEGSK